jgi:excisionase family DNA binding protein
VTKHIIHDARRQEVLRGESVKAANVLTTREAALRLGISLRRLMALLAEGRLQGAYKIGMIWQIPQGAIETRIKQKARFYARHER